MVRLPQPGDRFAAKYQIDRQIGQGGFSTVYAAVDVATQRRVAIKVLRPDGDHYETETIRRFEREVKVLSQLASAHTVRLFDSGQAEGLLWAAFERIPGRDLSELLNDVGSLSVEDTSHILRQVLESLREAHAHGLLHRDLKPENLRVFDGASGPLTVKVIDFGIARASDTSHPSLTKTGELLGTPRYMSPEQLHGADLDRRSDLYTVGLIGLELVAGRDVLGANRLWDQVERLRHDTAFDVPELGDSRQARRLRAVITKLIATDPEQRFQTAAQVMNALGVSSNSTRVLERRGSVHIAAALALFATLAAGLYWALAPAPPTQTDRATSPPDGLFKDRATSVPLHHTAVADASAAPAPPVEEALFEPFEGVRDFERTIPGEAFRPTRDEVRPVFVVIPPKFDPSNDPKLLLIASDGRLPPDDVLAYFDVLGGAAKRNVIVIVPTAETATESVWNLAVRRDARADIAAVRSTLGLEDAPLFALGEGNGAQGIDHLICDGLRFAAVVKTGYGYKRFDKGTPVHRRCFPDAVPTLTFVQLQDQSRPADGVDCDGIGWLPRRALQDDAFEAHGCKDETTQHDACTRWTCDVALESCAVDGGRNWRSPAWGSAERSDCVGPVVAYPYTEQTWSFFDRMTAAR